MTGAICGTMPGPRSSERAARAAASATDGGVARGQSGAVSTGGFAGSNGSGAPPSARNCASSRSNSVLEALPPDRLDQELHPVLVLVLIVAEPVVDADDGLGDVEHLADRQEVEELEARSRHRRGAAGDEHAEAALRRRARAPRQPMSLIDVKA